MTSLLIKDLSLAQRLGREAAASVRGGLYTYPVEPDGGNGGNGGSVPCVGAPWPWPIAAMPTLPAMPMNPFFPRCGYDPRVSNPGPPVRAVLL